MPPKQKPVCRWRCRGEINLHCQSCGLQTYTRSDMCEMCSAAPRGCVRPTLISPHLIKHRHHRHHPLSPLH
ncbi:hypothetical protein K470DRAFT_45834 [Piedraia hortae CBS 480.64]|uniref:Uncharacterized protein n=1 Tax=Piedraia hortae CBS 480.64 TaxID=1314780 RepID=A0A6A7C0Y6_9PEZI|nr:hypothetical protein K470DRAFT_45834 [Piedraia hortae CBS 480.64]